MNSDTRTFLLCFVLFILAFALFYSVFSKREAYPRGRRNEVAVFSHPYTAQDIKDAFVGPWIPKEKKDLIRHYYRPIAIVAYSMIYDAYQGNNRPTYLARLHISGIKLVIVFVIFFLLSKRSPLIAFLGTCLYAISFKLYDETVIFQCLPDLLVTTAFYLALLLFMLFSLHENNLLISMLVGLGTTLSFAIALGIKENGIFFLPTAVLFRIIYGWRRGTLFENVKTVFDRKHLVLFTLYTAVASGYIFLRYQALGREYLFTNSYETRNDPKWTAIANFFNSFIYDPCIYMDLREYRFDDLHGSFLSIVILFVIIALALMTRKFDGVLKRGVLFSLGLIAINTFFYSHLIRVRFNSIANISSTFLLLVGIVFVFFTINKLCKNRKIAIALFSVLLSVFAGRLCLKNIANIHAREDSTRLHHPRKACSPDDYLPFVDTGVE